MLALAIGVAILWALFIAVMLATDENAPGGDGHLGDW
jgi:hypothetical protein